LTMTKAKRRRLFVYGFVLDYLKENGPTNIRVLSKRIESNSYFCVSTTRLGLILRPLVENGQLKREVVAGELQISVYSLSEVDEESTSNSV